MTVKTLYLSDLDGTLLRPDERLSGYTVDVLNRFVSGGGLFSYATARSLVTAAKATEGLKTAVPAIVYNGAFIVDSAAGKLLLSNYFSRDEAASIRALLSEHGILPIVYAYIGGSEKFSYVGRDIGAGMRFFLDSRLGDPRRREVPDADALYMGDLFYFTCIGAEPALEPVYAELRDDLRFNCMYHKDIYSGAPWLEILPAKATKANAALQLKSLLGCDRLVSFGDHVNDLSLFAVSDDCYAVENAVPELKAAATAVIGSNTEDGVARWIEACLF